MSEIDTERKRRERAYYIWEREGRPDGQADSHWHQADSEGGPTEEALDSALDDSFPASDPPAMSQPSVAGKAKRSRKGSEKAPT